MFGFMTLSLELKYYCYDCCCYYYYRVRILSIPGWFRTCYVAEDDHELLIILRRPFESAGLQVTTAYPGYVVLGKNPGLCVC